MSNEVTVVYSKGAKTSQVKLEYAPIREFLESRVNIGEEVNALSLGLNEPGIYRITGASSDTGSPYTSLVKGSQPRRVLLSRGRLLKTRKKGLRLSKRLFPIQLTPRISQINLAFLREE